MVGGLGGVNVCREERMKVFECVHMYKNICMLMEEWALVKRF